MTEAERLTEEVFCLNFELNTLANQLLRQSSERWVPGFLYEKTEYSHIERYKLACNYTAGKRVIDIACGVGKGSNLMALQGAANSVYGADIQPDAIRYAQWRNGRENITFQVNDAQQLGIENAFDIAVSFETIEHLPDYRKFLTSIKTTLTTNGLFLVSTPIASIPIDNTPANPYHVQEWGFREFHHVIDEFFNIEKVYVQLYPEIPLPPPVVRIGLTRRVLNKIKNKLLPPPHKAETPDPVIKPDNGFSKIEEYTGQYNTEELGKSRLGYQIIVARVK
ncbi:class I SAM-dependent methyltransferase [Mucilaginibacter kameinonensis]|uniref:class I SAM-dependent methyltransferase n=1 Tax=Mucilaginibacter kameinonensis TaxID=452286 RepID=UPI000EF7BB68|nr:class I SAM-dependent methyltransferase [Mucilaginibacter kameinonensis]